MNSNQSRLNGSLSIARLYLNSFWILKLLLPSIKWSCLSYRSTTVCWPRHKRLSETYLKGETHTRDLAGISSAILPMRAPLHHVDKFSTRHEQSSSDLSRCFQGEFEKHDWCLDEKLHIIKHGKITFRSVRRENIQKCKLHQYISICSIRSKWEYVFFRRTHFRGRAQRFSNW